MIETFYYLPKRPFSDNFYELESVRDVVALLDSIVTLFIVKTIIDQPF